jgi:ferredoxin
MKVWIDPDLCIGNGICEELCPDLFIVKGGKAYVLDRGTQLPPGPAGTAFIPAGLEEAAVEAAEACPGECIYIDSA